MKTYNWEQVIKALRENNNLKFKTKDNRMTIVLDKSRLIRFKDELDVDCSLYGLNPNEEFVIIQKQVSFMEAIKAYSEGKTIMCKVGADKYEYKPYHAEETPNSWNKLITDMDSPITSYEILNGKWYTEEDI